MPNATPPEIKKVTRRIEKSDPEIFRPNNLPEWVQFKKVETVLTTWANRAASELALREKVTKWVFQLVACEAAGVFGILVAVGLGKLEFSARLLEIVIPAIFAEIVGLGLIVAKYLFDASSSKSLQELIKSVLIGLRESKKTDRRERVKNDNGAPNRQE
jgi:hypothetical protein